MNSTTLAFKKMNEREQKGSTSSRFKRERIIMHRDKKERIKIDVICTRLISLTIVTIYRY